MSERQISRSAGRWLAQLEALKDERLLAVYAIARGEQGAARPHLANIRSITDDLMLELNDEVTP